VFRRRKQKDFEAEIEAHLVLEANDLKERGLTEEQARTAARRAFGNTTLVTERFYEKGRWLWLDTIAADVRYTIRTLLKAPAFTATVLIALALGIGANTAVFTVLKTVVLEPLPYPNSDRIVNIGRPGSDSTTNIPKYVFWEQNNPGLEDLAAYHTAGNMNLMGGDRPEPVKVVTASRKYFRLFGANPILGRTFTASEDTPGGPNVAMMSYGLWQRRFGGQSSIIGSTITLGGKLYTVVGILSPSFEPNPPGDVWVPLQADASDKNLANILTVAARLPANVTLPMANSWMAVIREQYLRMHPQRLDKEVSGQEIQVAFMQRQITGNVRPALLILLGAVGLLLLIACANVANLLLARATSRQREMAIRAAIGAGRRRIMRQLLTESILLALGGGALGLALGSWGVRALLALTPGDLPRLQELAAIPALDFKVAAFSLSLSVVTGVLFGLVPAFPLSGTELTLSLNEAGFRGSSSRHNRARAVCVAAEVAISVVLLCGAVLLFRSFVAMHAVRLGFDPNNLLTVELSLAGPGYSESASIDRLAQDVVQRAERVPGVESAAIASALPLFGGMDMIFNIPGRTPSNRAFDGDVQWRYVSPEYFQVLRIPLISGRLLREQESVRVVLINQAMARRFWPAQNPIGQTIFVGPGLGPSYQVGLAEIAGVVGDVRERLYLDPSPIMYLPPSQIPNADIALLNAFERTALLLRTRPGVAPMTISQPVQKILLATHNLPAVSIRTMDQVSLDSTARQNFSLVLLGLFASVALLLAIVGIYGVTSYAVEQRTHEIGIRTALGANRRDTLQLILVEALRIAIVGVVIGIIGAGVLTRFLAAQLFAVRPLDPLTFIIVPVILLATTLGAAYVPALRAARVDPMMALRHE
jgi:putative ABC transport system permease protein